MKFTPHAYGETQGCGRSCVILPGNDLPNSIRIVCVRRVTFVGPAGLLFGCSHPDKTHPLKHSYTKTSAWCLRPGHGKRQKKCTAGAPLFGIGWVAKCQNMPINTLWGAPWQQQIFLMQTLSFPFWRFRCIVIIFFSKNGGTDCVQQMFVFLFFPDGQ